MRVVFLGSGVFGIPTLNFLREHDIPLVVTQPDRQAGRGRRLAPTPIKTEAESFGLEVLDTPNVNAPEVVERVLALQPAVGIVAAFGQKIGSALCDGIRGGCVNLHASLLPRHRGASPIHHAIMHGDLRTGVTIFRLVERMDAGPVLVQRSTAINPEETTTELHDRLAGIAVDAARATLAMFEENACPPGTAQDESLATRAPKLSKTDGRIRFDRPAQQVADHICAMWSWPGATCLYRSANGSAELEVTVARARPAEAATTQDAPGTIDARMLVSTADGMLEILEIKPAGGRLMTWPEFVNGRHVKARDQLLGRSG